MRYAKIIGLYLLAMFALGAIAADVAAAGQPEYKMCEKAAKVAKRYTGGYNNKECTEVNTASEGKYTTKAVVTPYGFEGNSKASRFYYHSPTEGVVWEVECKKDDEKGVITSPTEGTELITFEGCQAANEITKARAMKCPASITATLESVLVEAYPAKEAGVLLYPGFAKAFECGSVTFGAMVGFEAGSVENTGKGSRGNFAVDQATGDQQIFEFYDFAEGEVFSAFLQSAVTGSPLLEVGLEVSVPLGPKKEVIVKS